MTPFWLRHQLGIVVFLGVLLLVTLSNLLTLKRLGRYPLPQRFPRVSILLPARNEEANIRQCVSSLLSQDYSDFEVLVLNDGSTDRTGEVLAELSLKDKRLRVLSGFPLPEGWLGKNWACQQLAKAATGELLLFTDADTVHHPQALRNGVAAMLAEGAHLMSGFLKQRLITWGEKLIVPPIFWCFFSFFPLFLAQKIRAPGLSLTNGQWMLFQRSAYQAVGGHSAVRESPIDDIMLGRRIKAKGFRWLVVDAGNYISCRMYSGFWAGVEGFTKNLFAVFDFRLAEYLFVWLWILVVALEPLFVCVLWPLGLAPSFFSLWPALLGVGEMLALWAIAIARLRFPLGLMFLYSVSILLLVLVAFRSLLWTATGRARWKGRPLPRQRVRLI